MAKAGRSSDQFIVRLPEGLRERIKIAADASGRSMNAEVVEVLEAAFPAPKPASFNLHEVIALQEAWTKAMGLDVDSRPVTSDILKEIWKIQTGDDADVDPKAREAVRAVLSEIKGKS